MQDGCNFPVCGWNPMAWPFKWKLLSSTFLWYCLVYYAIQGFSSWLSLWVKSYGVTIQIKAAKWAVLFCATVYYAGQVGSNFWVCGWKPVVWPFKRKLRAVLSQGTIYCKIFCKMKFNFFFQLCLQFFTTISGCGCLIPVTWEICHLSNQTCDVQWSGLSE